MIEYAQVSQTLPDLRRHDITDCESQIKPKASRKVDNLRSRLWKALRVFRRDDTKFAIKVGAGAAIYVRNQRSSHVLRVYILIITGSAIISFFN